MADVIGSVQVDIVGDAGKLNSAIQQAQSTAAAGAEKIGSSFNAAAIKTATLQLSVDTLRQKYDALAASGVRTAAAQQQMDNIESRLAIAQAKLANAIQATTQSAVPAAAALETVARSADHAEVSAHRATAALVHVAEGTGLARAGEQFALQVLKIGPLAQAIFPLAGGIAFGEMLVELGKKAVEFFENLKEAQEKANAAFHAFLAPLQTTNDELDLSNAKLANEIALLEGRPENNVAVALAEANVQADKLAETLQKDFEGLQKVMKDWHVTIWQQVMTGAAGTGDADDAVANMAKDMAKDALKYNAKVHAAGTPEEKEAALKAWDDQKKRRLDWYAEWSAKHTESAEAAGKAKPAPVMLDSEGKPLAYGMAIPGQNVKQLVDALGAMSTTIADEKSKVDKEALNRAQATQKAEDEIAKRATEEAKKRAAEWIKTEEKKLALQKSMGDLTVVQEIETYNSLIAAAQQYGGAYNDLVDGLQIKANNLTRQYREERGKEFSALIAQQRKAFEDELKTAEQRATAAGQMPKTAALQAAQAKIAGGQGTDIGGYAEAMKQIPILTQGAAKESTELLQRMVRDDDAAFEAAGKHTASAVKAHADAVLVTLMAIHASSEQIDAAIKKSAAASKAAIAEQEKLADISGKAAGAHAESGIQAEKIALQGQYAAQVTHTYQQEIAYQKQVAALDERILILKRAEIEAEITAANVAGDYVKEAQDRARWAAANDAINNHRLQTEIQLGETARKNSLEWQIQTGLMHTADSAVSKLTSAMSGMILQTKNWKDGFKNAIDSINKEILDVLIGTALKKLERALQQAIGPSSGGGSATGGGGVFSGSQGGGIFSLFGSRARKDSSGVPTSGPGSGVGLGGWGAAPAAGESGEMDELASMLGGKAGGGDITGPTVVGERGWELAIPQVPTTIIPHDASVSMLSSMAAISSGSGRGGDMHFHGGMDFRGAQQGVSNEVNAAIVAAKNEAVRASLNAHREVQRRTPRRPS